METGQSVDGHQVGQEDSGGSDEAVAHLNQSKKKTSVSVLGSNEYTNPYEQFIYWGVVVNPLTHQRFQPEVNE